MTVEGALNPMVHLCDEVQHLLGTARCYTSSQRFGSLVCAVNAVLIGWLCGF